MQTIETGVLVVGGGGAGARAAVEARLAGADVILATKGMFGAIGTRGSGGTAGGGSAGSVFATPGWTGPLSEVEQRLKYMAAPEPQQAYDNIVQAGLGMADPKLVRTLIENAVESRTRLLEWGATFSEPGLRSHGVPLMAALAIQARKSGVRIMDRTAVVRLLIRDGECCGAVALDEATGKPVCIRAAAVILCTGGDAHLFMHNLNPSGNTGDAYSLGFEAGAELTNLEFKQIFLGTIYPSHNMLTQITPPEARLLDGEGKEFLAHYLPEGATVAACLKERNTHNPFSTRDRLSRYADIAIVNEIMKGNGTPRDGVYLDRTGPAIPPMSDIIEEFWEYRGIDFSKPVEIAVCHHCSLGGLRIDVNGETSVPHLYAAGEAAAGPHGADRMGGHMLLASQVFGAKAGKHAAAFALKNAKRQTDDRAVTETERHIKALENSRGGATPRSITVQLRRSAYFNLLVMRSPERIGLLREDVARIRREELPKLNVNSPKDLVEACELENLLRLADIEAAVCLERKESRGPHYREDYPIQDNRNWVRVVIAKKDGDGIKLDTAVVDPDWQDKGDQGIGYWG